MGLERMGGIAAFDVTNPAAPTFEAYVNPRNFAVDTCLVRDDEGDCETGSGNANPEAGDLGPEWVVLVPWTDSPNRRPLLLVGNEVSGATMVYEIGLAF